MGLMDVLSQYQNSPNRPPPEVIHDFELVSQEADAEELGAGIEEAFRSEQTPAFEQMVGQLYDRSDEDQRAALISHLQSSFAPAALGGLAGGSLIDLIRRAAQGNRAITPREARNVPAQEVEQVAAEAARQNPNIIERVSRFYAKHPALVQTLGQAALAIAMNTMARRRRM